MTFIWLKTEPSKDGSKHLVPSTLPVTVSVASDHFEISSRASTAFPQFTQQNNILTLSLLFEVSRPSTSPFRYSLFCS
jgi:hypothetical protein